MQEALERALRKNPESDVAPIVQGEVNKQTEVEAAHERHSQLVRENLTEWTKDCNQWARLGREYSWAFYSIGPRADERLDRVRENARRLLPGVVKWEPEGIAHILGVLDRGFRDYSFTGRYARLGVSFDAGIFVADFKNLMSFDDTQTATLNEALKASQEDNPSISTKAAYLSVANWLKETIK